MVVLGEAPFSDSSPLKHVYNELSLGADPLTACDDALDYRSDGVNWPDRTDGNDFRGGVGQTRTS